MAIGDIKEVQDFFWDIRAAWEMIGLELGIDMSTVDSIERMVVAFSVKSEG